MTEQMEMLGRMVLMAGKLDKTAQMVQTAMIWKIPTITYALFQTCQCRLRVPLMKMVPS